MSRVFRQYHAWRLPACLCIEFLLIGSAVMLSAAVRLSLSEAPSKSSLYYVPHAILAAVICQLCMYYANLYELKVAFGTRILFSKLAQSITVSAVVLMMISYMLPQLDIGRGILILSMTFSWCFLCAWRLFYQQLHTMDQFKSRVLIIGTSLEARKLAEELLNNRALGYEFKGFIGENDEVDKDLL
jgi:FlaA1/EpsC-like NDP-sugar epimerase